MKTGKRFSSGAVSRPVTLPPNMKKRKKKKKTVSRRNPGKKKDR